MRQDTLWKQRPSPAANRPLHRPLSARTIGGLFAAVGVLAFVAAYIIGGGAAQGAVTLTGVAMIALALTMLTSGFSFDGDTDDD